MRDVEFLNSFIRDYKKEEKRKHSKYIDKLLKEVIELLKTDQPLPIKYRDHALVCNWNDHRECHLKDDLIIIYRKTDDNALILVRIGSHSELKF